MRIILRLTSQSVKPLVGGKSSLSLAKVNAIFIFVYLVKADFILID